jgi:hypothetical protein
MRTRYAAMPPWRPPARRRVYRRRRPMPRAIRFMRGWRVTMWGRRADGRRVPLAVAARGWGWCDPPASLSDRLLADEPYPR